MSLNLIAKALGSGVERAALTPHVEWVGLLASKESISDSFSDENGAIAAFELLAVQELEDLGEMVIEVRVLASDGHRELTAYFYARQGGASEAC